MELIRCIAHPELDARREDEAFALALTVFQQMPDDLAVIHGAYIQFHAWLNEWIATGKRPDLSELNARWDDLPSADILPFKRPA